MNQFLLFLCKIILIIFNFILFVVSIVLITLGVGLAEARNILVGTIVTRLMRDAGFHVTVEDEFVEMGLDLLSILPAEVIISIQIVGGVLLAIAISGILGAFCARPYQLYIHALLMFVTFVFLMFLMTQFITEAEFTRNYMILIFRNGLNKSYTMKPVGMGTGFTFFFNNIQSKLNCCGVVNYTDFNITKDFKSSHLVVPVACCVNFNVTDCTKLPTSKNSFVNTSCMAAGWKKVGGFYDKILLTVLVISVSLFTIMFCDILLGKHMSDEQKEHKQQKGAKKGKHKGGQGKHKDGQDNKKEHQDKKKEHQNKNK
ncbi:Tetraspanin [Cichlidogyrus casuarinus]|uniref:Tetraspanin n=1 Tax=Cichlidogyrus casuarinus TaxID=1844966 RepID=A0ABD2QRE0_9PLAT